MMNLSERVEVEAKIKIFTFQTVIGTFCYLFFSSVCSVLRYTTGNINIKKQKAMKK